MKLRLFLPYLVLFIGLTTQAQTVHFEYDASGNRTNRWVETKDLKDPAADTTFKLGKEFWPSPVTEVLSEVKVFPNPVAHELNVLISNLGEATATALVCDVQGRPVLSVPKLSATNSLNLTGLSHGTYFLLLQCGEEKRVWKLVKE
jgi:hypothetical protein